MAEARSAAAGVKRQHAVLLESSSPEYETHDYNEPIAAIGVM